jgi:hypothetical protein
MQTLGSNPHTTKIERQREVPDYSEKFQMPKKLT